MKRKVVVLSLAVLFLCFLAGCKEKRCKCTTNRRGKKPAVGLELKGNHRDCSELNAEWMASDSTHELLTKTCVDEE